MANKHQVLKLYDSGLSTPAIAARLDCMPEYVRATLRRAGLTVPLSVASKSDLFRLIMSADARLAELGDTPKHPIRKKIALVVGRK